MNKDDEKIVDVQLDIKDDNGKPVNLLDEIMYYSRHPEELTEDKEFSVDFNLNVSLSVFVGIVLLCLAIGFFLFK